MNNCIDCGLEDANHRDAGTCDDTGRQLWLCEECSAVRDEEEAAMRVGRWSSSEPNPQTLPREPGSYDHDPEFQPQWARAGDSRGGITLPPGATLEQCIPDSMRHGPGGFDSSEVIDAARYVGTMNAARGARSAACPHPGDPEWLRLARLGDLVEELERLEGEFKELLKPDMRAYLSGSHEGFHRARDAWNAQVHFAQLSTALSQYRRK